MSQAEYEPELLHRDAIAALLANQLAEQGSTIPVYVDHVPRSPQYPYLVVWSGPGTPSPGAERLAGWGGEIVTTTQITAAGLTPDDVIGAAGRCRHALHRRRPAMTGRRCGDLDVSVGSGRPTPDPPQGPGGQTVLSLPIYAELHSSLSSI